MKSHRYKYENKTNLNHKTQATFNGQMYETNIPDLLELVHYTDDIALLTKAFYSLGFYLLSQEPGCDHIIKCRFLYDKILLVLNCCLQSKVSVALDFISSLLLFGDDKSYSRKQTLHIYAQNMIRTSGCLAAMCNLFTNCMMCITKCSQEHVEVFLLLQSLLSDNDRHVQLFHECNGMSIFTKESLQYPECLFLLNTIVENTGQENIAILKKSIQVFDIIESFPLKFGSQSVMGQWASIILYSKRKAGIDLERDIDHSNRIRDKPEKINIEPKSTSTQSDNDTAQLFRNVFKEIITLQEENNINYKKNINPLVNLEKGLYKETLAYNFKPINRYLKKEDLMNGYSFSHPIEKTVRNKSKSIDLSFSFLRKVNETCENIKTVGDIHNDNCHSRYLEGGVDRNYNTETRTQPNSQLYRIKTNKAASEDFNQNFGVEQRPRRNFTRQMRNPQEIQTSFNDIDRIDAENLYPSVDPDQILDRNVITTKPISRDIEVSYRSETNRIKSNNFKPRFGLIQEHFIRHREIPREIELSLVNEVDKMESDNIDTYFDLEQRDFIINTQREINLSRFNESGKKSNIVNNTILEFKPPFVSTPKHRNIRQYKHSSSSFFNNPTSSSIRKFKLNRNNQGRYKGKLNITTSERNQNKSMSAKFLDLINGSCTTLVKSFTNIRNIFKSKPSKNEDTQEENTVTVDHTDSKRSCSYSFTNYMQERDEKCMNMDLYEKRNIDCTTCNDTEVLRQKMENDKTLQQTVKRLKLGINLYGCDFKRISRTMWPRDTYMTPSVLYNLYRKLILK